MQKIKIESQLSKIQNLKPNNTYYLIIHFFAVVRFLKWKLYATIICYQKYLFFFYSKTKFAIDFQTILLRSQDVENNFVIQKSFNIT